MAKKRHPNLDVVVTGVIDSHCHLQSVPAEEREAVLDRARERGVTGFLIPAIRLSDADLLLELCAAHDDVWCALGTHPHEAGTWQDGDVERLRDLAQEPKVVAIGECGLDFYYDHAPRDVQDRVMRQQWTLAQELGLPVVIHNRDSNEAMTAAYLDPIFETLATDFHSYAGGKAMAEAILPKGAYMGFSGMVTFNRADNVREVLPLIDRDKILVETDTPYLAPVPHRGKTNEPAFVVDVLIRVAQELDLTVQDAADLTRANFHRLFPKTLSA